jgi:hypothetical protein
MGPIQCASGSRALETSVDLEFPPESRIEPTISCQHIEKLLPDEYNKAPQGPELIDGEEAYEWKQLSLRA